LGDQACRFFENKEHITKVRSCFAGLWGLDDENSAAIIEEAIRNPEGFVLKPQREGGGSALFMLYSEVVLLS
jgi:glutathione synthase